MGLNMSSQKQQQLLPPLSYDTKTIQYRNRQPFREFQLHKGRHPKNVNYFEMRGGGIQMKEMLPLF